jgi:phage-related protein (TIGR01555 family)
MMRRFQGIEGLTILDANDEFEAQGHQAFSGLSDALMQFGQQLSGALQIPLVRLFGQSPAGLNSSGDSDLRTYYDGINSQQESRLRLPFDWMLRLTAKSEGIVLPPNFNYKFKSLWQSTPEQNAAIAEQRTRAVLAAVVENVIDIATALKELRQIGADTGTFTNVTNAMIQLATLAPPPTALGMPGLGAAPNPLGRHEALPGEETRPV